MLYATLNSLCSLHRLRRRLPRHREALHVRLRPARGRGRQAVPGDDGGVLSQTTNNTSIYTSIILLLLVHIIDDKKKTFVLLLLPQHLVFFALPRST